MASEKAAFFETMAEQGLALTFDDVRLRTGRSHVTAQEVDTRSRFSRNVELNVPLVSAAMDTVTTSDMAIAMAKLGGLGVIHGGLSVREQRDEVRRVKLYLNGLIEKPIAVEESQSVASVLEMCDKRNFDFRTFPVINKDYKFVGLLTQNDFDFCEDKSQTIEAVMTPQNEVKSALGSIAVAEAYELMKDHKKKTLPLRHEDGSVAGMYVLSDVLRAVHGNPSQYNLDSRGSLRVAAATTTDEEGLERIRQMREYLDAVVIDTAQGDTDFVLKTLKDAHEEFPDLDVVAGNVSEAASARALAEAGADGIKVGQGPGSICSTRPETGIGCPQVTAVHECVKAVEGLDVPVCADGGLSHPGDISIAIAAGAHSVMMGSMLAATKETPGEVIGLEDGSMVKLYRGMGSPSALKDSAASRKRYGVEGSSGKPLAEGIEAYVPYRGSVNEVVDHYVKALRKSMSYVGAENIEAHRERTGFWRITAGGLRESHPHDVRVIK